MKIMTLNVNGIRAAINKGLFDYLEKESPDIVCFQEIKALESQIPLMEFNLLGYNGYWFPAKKKGYSGTAILTKFIPDNIVKGMGIEEYDNEGRLISIDYKNHTFISVYHPSGSSGDERQKFKMKWLDDFDNYIENLRVEKPKLIISGDFNICHTAMDIHDPVRNRKVSGFLPEERDWIDKFFLKGHIDTFRHLVSEPDHYTWWSYRANAKAKNLGWRIDYNLVTENLKYKIKSVRIDPEVNFSDHCPVFLDLKI